MHTIAQNIQKIQYETQDFAYKLIAVSKTKPLEAILSAYEAGQRIFAENKVQEMESKQPHLPSDIEWHLIGHLQSNKVKYVAPYVDTIHSIDSFKLLEEVNKQAFKHKRIIKCLLQLHIAQEETKFGLSEEEALEILQHPMLETFENVCIIGVMGMATFTENEEQIRAEFRGLKRFFDSIQPIKRLNVALSEISMGMSSDYWIALEEGSTMIRVGSLIFGSR